MLEARGWTPYLHEERQTEGVTAHTGEGGSEPLALIHREGSNPGRTEGGKEGGKGRGRASKLWDGRLLEAESLMSRKFRGK